MALAISFFAFCPMQAEGRIDFLGMSRLRLSGSSMGKAEQTDAEPENRSAH